MIAANFEFSGLKTDLLLFLTECCYYNCKIRRSPAHINQIRISLEKSLYSYSIVVCKAGARERVVREASS